MFYFFNYEQVLQEGFLSWKLFFKVMLVYRDESHHVLEP